jgi:hypothetical protein
MRDGAHHNVVHAAAAAENRSQKNSGDQVAELR